jgi:hypothetical protein
MGMPDSVGFRRTCAVSSAVLMRASSVSPKASCPVAGGRGPRPPGESPRVPRTPNSCKRATMRLPSDRDGRRSAGGVLPPGHFGQPLGHIRPFRIQRARLLKGGSRVGPLPRRETGIPVRKGLEGTGLRGLLRGRLGPDRRAPIIPPAPREPAGACDDNHDKDWVESSRHTSFSRSGLDEAPTKPDKPLSWHPAIPRSTSCEAYEIHQERYSGLVPPAPDCYLTWIG